MLYKASVCKYCNRPYTEKNTHHFYYDRLRNKVRVICLQSQQEYEFQSQLQSSNLLQKHLLKQIKADLADDTNAPPTSAVTASATSSETTHYRRPRLNTWWQNMIRNKVPLEITEDDFADNSVTSPAAKNDDDIEDYDEFDDDDDDDDDPVQELISLLNEIKKKENERKKEAKQPAPEQASELESENDVDDRAENEEIIESDEHAEDVAEATSFSSEDVHGGEETAQDIPNSPSKAQEGMQQQQEGQGNENSTESNNSNSSSSSSSSSSASAASMSSSSSSTTATTAVNTATSSTETEQESTPTANPSTRSSNNINNENENTRQSPASSQPLTENTQEQEQSTSSSGGDKDNVNDGDEDENANTNNKTENKKGTSNNSNSNSNHNSFSNEQKTKNGASQGQKGNGEEIESEAEDDEDEDDEGEYSEEEDEDENDDNNNGGAFSPGNINKRQVVDVLKRKRKETRIERILRLKGRRVQSMFADVIRMIAETPFGLDIPGNESWNMNEILTRKVTKKPLHKCRKGIERNKVVLILDTSGSCAKQAHLYEYISRLALAFDDIEVYEAPNGYIESKIVLENKKTPKRVPVHVGAQWPFTFTNRTIIYFGDFDGGDIVITAAKKNNVFWLSNENRYEDTIDHGWCSIPLRYFKGIYLQVGKNHDYDSDEYEDDEDAAADRLEEDLNEFLQALKSIKRQFLITGQAGKRTTYYNELRY